MYFSSNHTESSFAAAPFTFPEKNNYMLFGGISESLLNSITLTYYTTRVSKITFSEEVIVNSINSIISSITYFVNEPELMKSPK